MATRKPIKRRISKRKTRGRKQKRPTGRKRGKR